MAMIVNRRMSAGEPSEAGRRGDKSIDLQILNLQNWDIRYDTRHSMPETEWDLPVVICSVECKLQNRGGTTHFVAGSRRNPNFRNVEI